VTGTFRGARSVEKLLKVARADVETLRIDLNDIERAKETAKRALEEILEAVDREAKSGGDPHVRAAYEEAMRERRFNLRKTLNALEAAADRAVEKLQAALAETAKLEHLAEVNARQAMIHARRKEARRDAERPASAPRNQLAGS
jgi:flagellar biosynthesis chaperone FliJ